VKTYIFIIGSIFLLLTNSCKKQQTTTNSVPLVNVDINIYVNNPSYINLNATGGWQYITGGVRGILLYRASSTEFKAYDRNCTYQSSNSCATVRVDNSNIIVRDSSCCNSQFSIVDGGVLQGPATLPLKAYNTSFDGNLLHIYN
jgi:nitrite reductase/ring-hydroxylating ferredoxin subunit